MITKALKIILKKPKRVFPHLRTRLAYLSSGLSKGYAAFPHVIYIGITNKCNLSCKMCDLGQGAHSVYSRHLSPKEDLPLEAWKRFIDEVAPKNPQIELCAAEPLLYKDLIPLVSYIKQQKNLKTSIFTNGYLLQEFGSFLNETGLDRLNVSIDGTPQIHDRIREKAGLFDRIMAGLGSLQKSARKNAIPVDINYTISEHNYSHINSTIKLLKDNGIKFNRFTIIHTLYVTEEMANSHNRLHPEYPVTGICRSGVDFSAIDTQELNSQIIKAMNDYPAEVRLYPDFDLSLTDTWYKKPEKFAGNKTCLFVWNSANIRSDGEVIPYVRCVDKTFGNIKEGFSGIWNSSAFRKFRLETKKSLFPICSRCSASFMK